MINKFYKRIYNKYSNLFKFFFFLRHVFVIFLISIISFLFIPKFFDYEKKQEIIKEYLINYYNLELISYSQIEYQILPFPNLYIKDVNLKIKNTSINLKEKNITIFLNLTSIYNYKNFKVKKILFKQNKVHLDINKVKDLVHYFEKLKYKLNVENLNVHLKKDNNTIIKIKNISFNNHGYQKYYIKGEIFDKKFKISLKNNNQVLNFKLLNTGVKANFKFDKKKLENLISGSSKINLSNNLLGFNFNLDNNQLKLTKSNFRNKDLSFSLDSLIKFNPFFSINSNINIIEINKNLINKLSLQKILKNREVIKKLNSKINIKYKSKKYFTKLIEDYSSNLNLSYGRLVFSNKILLSGGEINCNGDSILIDEYPRLNFICSLVIKDKKKLFKFFSISHNTNKEILNIYVEGSLNIFNKKTNFKKISIDKSYLANKEDILYFKETFERVLFNDGFLQIFNKNKIKNFFLEII